jgi:phenylpyruvate tautomerase PptA (4-oxalocrotonate tautomerase family)
MPLVTITVRKPKPVAFKRAILDRVHEALVSVGVPADDRFQRVLELEADDFSFDAHYPDVQGARDQDFVIVEVLWSIGRSVKVKKQFLRSLTEGLAASGLRTENVMVVFTETNWENWAFAGGRQIHV